MPKKEKHTKDRCDRCGRVVRDGRGVYRGSAWDTHLRSNERFVCWACLDEDPYFRAMNTPQPSDY